LGVSTLRNLTSSDGKSPGLSHLPTDFPEAPISPAVPKILKAGAFADS